MKRWLGSITGLLLAGLPMAALATEEGRALEMPADWGLVITVTLLAILGLAVVGAIGYLYRRERSLDWDFQRPDAPDQH